MLMHRRVRVRVRVWAAGLFAISLFGLGGCGKSDSEIERLTGHTAGEAPVSDTKMVSHEGYAVEFRTAVQNLAWPKGYAKPTRVPNNDQSSTYQVGAGEGDAVGAWQCAWSGVYLKNKDTDKVKATEALDVYATIKTMNAWNAAFSDPSTRAVIENAIAKARLGDGSELQQMFSANC